MNVCKISAYLGYNLFAIDDIVIVVFSINSVSKKRIPRFLSIPASWIGVSVY